MDSNNDILFKHGYSVQIHSSNMDVKYKYIFFKLGYSIQIYSLNMDIQYKNIL